VILNAALHVPFIFLIKVAVSALLQVVETEYQVFFESHHTKNWQKIMCNNHKDQAISTENVDKNGEAIKILGGKFIVTGWSGNRAQVHPEERL
jgi:hypothetical protein